MYDAAIQKFSETSALGDLQAMVNDYYLLLKTIIDKIAELKKAVADLEAKDRFDGSIWMKDGKYAYKIYYVDGKRKREYVGKDGEKTLRQAIKTQQDYQNAKGRLDKLYSEYSDYKGRLRYMVYQMDAKQTSF